MKKPSKTKKSVIALENLTIPLYKISFLRKDPITGANQCRLSDGSSLSISNEEYQVLTNEMVSQNEDENYNSRGQRL